MRINIYSQELLTDFAEARESVELVQTKANTGIVYSAVRVFLHSSDRLHHSPDDDDRSAVTFWLPKSEKRREALAQTFEAMAALVRDAEPETGLD